MNIFLLLELIETYKQVETENEVIPLDFAINQVHNVIGCGCKVIREGNLAIDKHKIVQLENEKWLLIEEDGTEDIIISAKEKLLDNKRYLNTCILGKYSNGAVLATINGVEGLHYIPFSQINSEGVVSDWYIGKLLERIKEENEGQEVD